MKNQLRRFNFIQKSRNRKIFKANVQNKLVAVEINNTIGIGARLAWVLEILAYCDEHHLQPQFRFTYPGSSTDYFKPFFRITTDAPALAPPIQFVKIFTIGELELGKNYDTVLTVELASHLIKKYLGIDEDILREVDTFCAENFADPNVLGIHYRGTDKSTEAPAVTYEQVQENIELYIKKFPETTAIFVSTDDHHFLKYMQNGAIERPVTSREDSFRAKDNAPIHLGNHNKYDINRDALVNSLLLSRCRALIKTASILSGWSVLFNPDIQLIMLNHPYDKYFPERALMERVLYEAG